MFEADTRGDGQAAGTAVAALRTHYRVHIRWLIRRDMLEVLEIDGLSFADSWIEDHFLRLLRERNVIGMVAERGDRVVGFMVYKLGTKFGRKHIELLRLAVHPAYRNRGVGRQLVRKLIDKLTESRRLLLIPVRETNVAAQCWLRALGIRAEIVLPGHFADTNEDAYSFEHRLPRGWKPPAGGPACDGMSAAAD